VQIEQQVGVGQQRRRGTDRYRPVTEPAVAGGLSDDGA
jgi:hypothetical protein